MLYLIKDGYSHTQEERSEEIWLTYHRYQKTCDRYSISWDQGSQMHEKTNILAATYNLGAR